jgi:flagellar motor switch protein FliG
MVDVDRKAVAELDQLHSIDKATLHELGGVRKSALLALIVGDESARVLFERLNIDEIKIITEEMTKLGRIKGVDVEILLEDFNNAMGAGVGVVGSVDTAKQLLSRILDDEKVALIMKDIGGPPGANFWQKLSKVDEQMLASFLKNEYPQTIAVVLSKIRNDHAARVLSILPKDIAIESMMRMLQLETVQDDIITDVEDRLRVEFVVNSAGKRQQDQHEVMADIFNYFDRTTETSFLEMVEQRNKDSAELIRSLMFTFDDLVKLDSPSVQQVLRNVDNSKLGMALKGAKDELSELFLGNMSERAAKILRDDMENMGPVRVKDVEEAQAEIVVATKALIDAGEIAIAGDDDDEMIS